MSGAGDAQGPWEQGGSREEQERTTDVGRAEVEGWWARLRARERRELTSLSDPRAESCQHQRVARADGSAVWYGLPIRVKGLFVNYPNSVRDMEDKAEEVFPWDLYEYLVADGPVSVGERVYHVCTRERAAREALRTGHLRADFTCPLARPDCPMRRLLDLSPGRSLRLQRA